MSMSVSGVKTSAPLGQLCMQASESQATQGISEATM
jgi:hypothetical protein